VLLLVDKRDLACSFHLHFLKRQFTTRETDWQ
jgi:hypothetical protein